ncbi:MAG: D-alanine--D-alanine ligase [Rubrobacter sp.]|nr:D-alanine--D-alanine ligase [Rubrobacter sp.]
MVIFGGRSGEHEVSLASARAVMDALESSGCYEVQPVGITREGRWLSGGDPLGELAGSLTEAALSPPRQAPQSREAGALTRTAEKLPSGLGEADVVFPVLHGPDGEDGTVQGLLELAGVPYVGSGVLASATGMDKVTMKKVFAFHGLPQVEWVGLTHTEWEADRDGWMRNIQNTTGYPCFVKPSNMGSSIGIGRADDPEELAEALDRAAEHDRRLIVEAGVDAREVEVSVLGNESPEVSVPGEIVVGTGGFYDYEAKYTAGASEILAPAEIPESVSGEMERVARAAYRSIDAAGFARVDFFLERGTDRLLLNEINTIPGFTPTSVYASLWDASGLPYQKLLDRLIELALERHAEKHGP